MIATLMFLAATALAHHSALGYVFTKTKSAHATLREMRWSAPNSTLIFEIKADSRFTEREADPTVPQGEDRPLVPGSPQHSG
jgi:hypothetical protein